jgi:hypothetical protein
MAHALFDSAANYATEVASDGWLPLAAFSKDMNCSDQPGMHAKGLICCCIPRTSYWPRPFVSSWRIAPNMSPTISQGSVNTCLGNSSHTSIREDNPAPASYPGVVK